MHIRVHKTSQGTIIAACDKELLGKVLEEGDRHLDLIKYADFYGKASSESELTKLLEGEYDSINLVGKRAVSVAIKLGIVEQSNVMHIKKVPYLQVYNI
jgi:hypothetical protein